MEVYGAIEKGNIKKGNRKTEKAKGKVKSIVEVQREFVGKCTSSVIVRTVLTVLVVEVHSKYQQANFNE